MAPSERVTLPDGRSIRIGGTPATNTKKAAEAAERAHIDRVLNPERARVTADAKAAPERKEKTIREHAETFLTTYKPESKPSEKRTKRWTFEARLLPYFGDMTISELDQPTIDGFSATEIKGRSAKSVNNPARNAVDDDQVRDRRAVEVAVSNRRDGRRDRRSTKRPR